MKITYEKATLKDIDEIINMQSKLNMMLGLNTDPDTNCLSEYLKEEMKLGESVDIIAKNENEIVGDIAISFSDSMLVDNIVYSASIPLIYVDEKYRNGAVAYNLFKLALKEIVNKGYNSLVMSVEDNNPNKLLHFAIADQLIEDREELLENGETTKQYLLAISDVKKVLKLHYKDIIKKVIYTKNNFEKVFAELTCPENVSYSI